MLDRGVAPEDVQAVARFVAFEAVFAAPHRIDQGHDAERADDGPYWALMEVDQDGALTGRPIDALREDILSLDPSGRASRPE